MVYSIPAFASSSWTTEMQGAVHGVRKGDKKGMWRYGVGSELMEKRGNYKVSG